MNRKTTPLLLLLALVLGLAAWWTARTHPGVVAGAGASRVLAIDPQEVTLVRVRQDYWNSFALSRTADGGWQIVEPSREPARMEQVRRLLDAATLLPVIATIDVPSNDSERYRQHGLWEPRVRLTLVTHQSGHTILFGNETDDHSGVYCALEGRDNIVVTSIEAIQVISAGLGDYRETATTSASGIPTEAP